MVFRRHAPFGAEIAEPASISAATLGARKSHFPPREVGEADRPQRCTRPGRGTVSVRRASLPRRHLHQLRMSLPCFAAAVGEHHRSFTCDPFPLPKPLRIGRNLRMPRRVVDVLVPVALDRAYSYRVPEKLDLAPGDIVCVPLGAREATAVVWAENPKPNPRFDNRLKDVEEKLEVPPLRPELRSFVDWVANYTLSSRGMVLRMCLRMGEHLGRRARACRRAACGQPAATHDQRAGPRARTPRRRHGAR